MTLGLFMYRYAMAGLGPFIPHIFQARLRKGKEAPSALHERRALNLPARPDGRLVWLHGASIGESKLLLKFAESLQAQQADLSLLFTSQTLSSATIVKSALPENGRHQMAPVDTPGSAKRFISHWQPDLCIFAESEIWPNLLQAAKGSGAKLMLLNARMREASLSGWQRVPRSARQVFANFDYIAAADQKTASGLGELTDRPIQSLGNLKASFARLKSGLDEGSHPIGKADDRLTLLGASTHEGEEVLLLDALKHLPQGTRLILAPRHVERANTIEEVLKRYPYTYQIRSEKPHTHTNVDIILADTFGEMDQWYEQADIVYLGGAHQSGIGGHNPLEPLQYAKPVITGPHTDNFEDTHESLQQIGGIVYASTPEDIARAALTPNRPDEQKLQQYFQEGRAALDITLKAACALLDKKRAAS